jgi:hypothetical protein
MRLTIERTDRLVTFQGRPVRVWHGTTDTGHPVEIFVAAMTGPGDENGRAAFEAALADAGVPHVPICERERTRKAQH